MLDITKFLKILFVIEFVTFSIKAQVTDCINKTNTGGTWQYKIHFFDKDTGVICVNHSTAGIRITCNGGTTWTGLAPYSDMRNMSWPTKQIGYLCGSNGKIYKTTNRSTFTLLNSGITTMLRIIHFTSPDTGFAAGDKGVLIKTYDGGATWTKYIPGDTVTSYEGLYFFNSKEGFLAGTRGTFISTKDGGETWEKAIEINDETKIFLDINFPSKNVGFVCGNQGMIYKTTDDGLN